MSLPTRIALVASALLALFIASCDSGLFGPDAVVAINGIVVDADTRAPIPNATVTISSGIDTVLITGVDGKFVVSNVPAGTYTATASADGYRTGSRQIAAEVSLLGPDTLALSPTMPVTGLLGYWPLNGSASDAAGVHHGVVSGASWISDRFGAPRSAVQFSGGSGSVSVPDASDLHFGTSTDFSVTAWVLFVAGQSSNPAIVSKTDPGSGRGFELGIKGDVPEAIVRGPSGSVSASTYGGLSGTSWHMIGFAVSRSQQRIELFVDGDYINLASGAAIAGSLDAAAPLLIGRSALSSSTFDGAIDDVRLFGRRLSAEDFRALYRERGWPR